MKNLLILFVLSFSLSTMGQVIDSDIIPIVGSMNGYEVFQTVEVNPEFPGGMDGLTRFISMNLKYPKDAVDEEAMGRIIVSFVVDRDGSVVDAKVLDNTKQGGGKLPVSCELEAIRVVESMPKWVPGKQKGKPVRVQYNLPIHYVFVGDDPVDVPPLGAVDSTLAVVRMHYQLGEYEDGLKFLKGVFEVDSLHCEGHYLAALGLEMIGDLDNEYYMLEHYIAADKGDNVAEGLDRMLGCWIMFDYGRLQYCASDEAPERVQYAYMFVEGYLQLIDSVVDRTEDDRYEDAILMAAICTKLGESDEALTYSQAAKVLRPTTADADINRLVLNPLETLKMINFK